MNKPDLALNNQQVFIYHETKPNQTLVNNLSFK